MSQPLPRKRFRIRPWLLVLAAVIVAVLLFGYFERKRGQEQLAAIKAQLKQRGYPISSAEMLANNATPDSRFEWRFEAIANHLRGNLLQSISNRIDLGLGKAVRGSQAPHPVLQEVGVVLTNDAAMIISGDLTSWQIMESLHATNEVVLAELRSMLSNPPKAFNGYSVLIAMDDAAWGLNDAVVRQLYRGELVAAEQNLVAMARLLRLHSRHRTLATVMTRVEVSRIGTDLLWDALQSDGWTEPQLAHLQQAWSEHMLLPDLVAGLHLERFYGLELYEQLSGMSYSSWRAACQKQFAALFGTGLPIYPQWADSGREYVFHPVWQNIWADQEMAAYLKRTEFMTVLPMQALRKKAFAGLATEFDKQSERGKGDLGNWRFYTTVPFNDSYEFIGTNQPTISTREVLKKWGSDFGLTSYAKVIPKAVKQENERWMVITTLALKRYILRHGHLPERLEELVPEFVKELPTDWMVGRPLRYRRNTDQTYTLYSVGDDGQDDGGSPEKDHVWPEAVPWSN